MIVRKALPYALALVMVLGACGNDDETSADETSGDEPSDLAPGGRDGDGDGALGDLTGRVFLSSAVTEDGQPRPLVEGTQIRIEFSEDGRVIANAGCNTMTGEATVDGDRLMAGQLATTEMGCDPPRHEQDSWLSDLFAANPTYELDGDQLRLTSGATVLELVDRTTADPDRPLEDTVWQLDGIVDGDAVSSVPGETPATLKIVGGNIEIADTGCNGGGGSVEIDADASELTVGPVIWTMMACGEPSMTIERAFSDVLEGTIAYDIEAGTLTLSHPDGQGLMFEARS